MGSAQSQPTRTGTRSRPLQPSTPHRPPLPAPTSTSSSASSRLSTLRRLSTLGRRESATSKRGRAGSGGGESGGGESGDQKKRKIKDEGQQAAQSSTNNAPTPYEDESGPSSRPMSPDRTSSLTPGPHSQPTHDPLMPERLRSLSTIQEALGPGWPASSSSLTPAVDRLRRRFRRQHSHSHSQPTPPPHHQPQAPSNSPPAPQSPSVAPPDPSYRVSDRISSLFGLSTTTPNPPTQTFRSENTDEDLDDSIEQLTSQLEQARSDLAESQRQIDDIQDGLDRQPQVQPNSASELTPRRLPAGAVLVIQGLAQTHAPDATSTPRDSSAESESNHTGGRQSSTRSDEQGQNGEDHNGASLESQARMIGGLLTVAAAATATTLLSPSTPNPSMRPSHATSVSSFLDRFRPHRRTIPSVESALGTYLRNVLRDHRPLNGSNGISGTTLADGGTPPGSGGPDTETTVSDEFRRFLAVLQGDLVTAVREFAAPSEDQTQGEDSGQDENTPLATSANTPTSESAANETQRSDEALPGAVPSFHRQLGQNLPNTRNTSDVSGGHDGQPRRLNFFRAHLFPPVREDEPTTPAGTDDPEGMVPCIFIGVRSISHDPSLTTDELVQHPSFPFIDGHVPAQASEETGDTTSNTTVTEGPSAPAPTPSEEPRRTLRERVMERIAARRTPRPTTTPLNTYLVYVIGGYYPRSHPVLSIPNLVTGGPLTDEEMALVSELMGPVKPPTATKDEIENSGLTVIDGLAMAEMGKQGKVLETCVERCLVCLSDYERGEECRILHCRHAYHKKCVDQWLSEGRNSCPACRSEAVETKKVKPLNGNELLSRGANPDIREMVNEGTSA